MAALRSSIKKFLGKITGESFPDAECAVYEDPVVIIHSPFKTGTTTIGWALVMAGFSDRDQGFRRDLNRGYKQQIDAANALAKKYDSFAVFRVQRGQEVAALMQGLLQHALGYRIFGDVPFGHLRIHPFVKKLIMPNAKFIWIDREQEAWLNSARKWQMAWPSVYPNADRRWADNPERERRKLKRLWNNGLREFRKLQQEFPQDCLVISLEADAGWQPLCDFLDLPVPDAEFPVLNKAVS